MDFKPLRNHIMQLAISGQLVPQLDSEPEVKQIGPAPEKVPFAIPEKWKWVQLGEVFSMQAGKSIRASQIADSGLYPCYGGNGLRGYVDSFNVSGTYNLIGRQGALCGNIHLVSGDFYATEHAVVAKHSDVIDPRCAYYFLTSLNLNQYATATAQPGLAVSKIAKVYCPLAPINEQHRIAAVVDDLFGRLDQMEAAYSEFAGPMTEHFRNTALQMAISGQLVPQLDSEPEVQQIGPAPEKVPFAIPEKWKWVELGKLLPFGRSKQVKPEQISANSWLLGLEEIESNGGLIRKCYDWESINSSKSAFKAGNVLYSKMRPYLNKVIIADEDGFCSTELLVLDVNQAHLPLHAGFMLYFLRAPYFVSLATKHSQGQKPRLDLKEGKKFLVPVPPLAEQRRIVAKLEELFSGVDKLGSLVAFT